MIDTSVALGDQGEREYAPAARVTFLNLPEDPGSAEDMGCTVSGSQGGSGLAGLTSLIGADDGLTQFVTMDENGEISLSLLAHAPGWEAGTSVADVGSIDMALYNGSQVESGNNESFLIDPASFDADGNPLISFAGIEVDGDTGWMETDEGALSLSLPIADGLPPIDLSIERTIVSGYLEVDGPGFGVQQALIQGYLTQEQTLALIEGLQTACGVENPPSLCDTVNQFLMGQTPDQVLGLIETFVGGFDSLIEGDSIEECVGGSMAGCNALSICLIAEMDGVVIDGLAAEE